MWKFNNFSAAQILREINVDIFRGWNAAILTTLEALKSGFWYILALKMVKFVKTQISGLLKWSKWVFDTMKSLKIDFT